MKTDEKKKKSLQPTLQERNARLQALAKERPKQKGNEKRVMNVHRNGGIVEEEYT